MNCIWCYRTDARRRSSIPPAEPGRFGCIRFRGGTFIAHRSQLHRTRSLAFFAPMPLGAGQPLSGSAIVANENFFSHAKEVLRGPGALAKCCFRLSENDYLPGHVKKGLPLESQFLQSASNRSLVMNRMVALKRSLVVVLTLSAFALCAFAASNNEPCPLPVNGTTTSSSDPTQSPEHPGCMRAVHHNGMIICLPCPAYDAHIRHGDTDAGPCDKPGNETPPGQTK